MKPHIDPVSIHSRCGKLNGSTKSEEQESTRSGIPARSARGVAITLRMAGKRFRSNGGPTAAFVSGKLNRNDSVGLHPVFDTALAAETRVARQSQRLRFTACFAILLTRYFLLTKSASRSLTRSPPCIVVSQSSPGLASKTYG